jgi:hypothetical protein
MPYKSIHWIKLEKRLLNDYRYYSMPERARLMFVELLMVAAETGNKIPQELSTLKTILRTSTSEKELGECLKLIAEKFPKFVKYKGFYIFKEWSTRTNQVYPTDNPGISQGAGQNMPGMLRVDIDKIRKEYITLKGYQESHLNSTDYGRIGVACKRLFKRAEGKVDLIIDGLHWLNNKKWDWWTLETLDKYWAEFMKSKNVSKPASAREADLSHIL